ncbi:MAG: hypothetical protein M3N08_00890, partial [Pseudomonadota bacterium]|nr:hypothetical protein [Pseudomonadota bacterium]
MTATTVNDDGLKIGLTISALLHAAFFLFLYFGLPIFFTPLQEHHDRVPFEVVEIADITNTRTKEPAPEVKPPEPPPKPPEPKPEPKPAPPPAQALPQPKPE